MVGNETTRAYEYDRNGSLTGKSGFARQGENQLWSTSSAYEYNGSDQLVRVFNDNGLFEYSYYPGGRRSSKRVNGETTRFVYHESRIIAELGEDYGLKASNLFGSGILFRETGDKTISYLTDGHGDVVGLSDAFGKVTSRKEYEPFGKERQSEATGFGKGILRELQREEADGIDNPFGYCGEYLDEETGFIYLRARYYSPDAGRFVSEDPIRDGLNWYGYCANDPINFIDPLGLEKIVVSGGEYDTEGGYDYEFIATGLKQINDWKNKDTSGETITWIIADEGWSTADKDSFINVAAAANVNVRFITDKLQLIDYINNKDGYRPADKITDFTIFSHGLPDGTQALGYNYVVDNYNRNLNFTKYDIAKLDPNSFDNPNAAFYSCNSGTGGKSSFAQKWVDRVGGQALAFVGKSDFTQINNNDSLASTAYNKLAKRNWQNFFGYYAPGAANYPVAGQTPLEDGSKPYTAIFKN